MAIINTVITGGGTTPTGSISITSNGTYDVTDKATAVVNVPTTAPALYREFQQSGTQILPNTTTTHIIDFSGVSRAVGMQAYMKGNTNITGVVDLSSINSFLNAGEWAEAFSGCSGLTGVTLPAADLGVAFAGLGYTRASLFYRTFNNCTGITGKVIIPFTQANHVDSVCRTMFYGCTGITSVEIPNFVSMNGGTSVFTGMFDGCTNLTGSVTFSALGSTAYSLMNCSNSFYDMFSGTRITEINFPAIKSTAFGYAYEQFSGLCSGLTGVTIHFPSNIQSDIESLSQYPNFGGTNTTVLFDLPATE